MLKKPNVPSGAFEERRVISAVPGPKEPPPPHSELIYEAPVRLWHWTTAAAIAVLVVTGYLIGKPLPTTPGEASSQYTMGYVRFAHFAAGYVLAIAFVGRLYWALVGNRHARELFTLPVFSASYWRGFGRTLKWYGFMSDHPEQFPGHNPLARLSMVLGYTVLTVFMICTGFALYGEGSQPGSWAERWFGWVIVLCGQSQNVHTLHHIGMWSTIVFVILHIYAVVRDDVVGPHSTVSSMISGKRAYKE